MKQLKGFKKITLALVAGVIVFLYVLYGEEDIFEIAESERESVVEHREMVTRVIDGDTFDIATGERVRMIGIDTPERGEEGYDVAKKYLESLIGNQEVLLQRDHSEVDRYGRLLRHVYIADNWINKTMIEEGYAQLVTFPPDVAHINDFQSAQAEAMAARRGMWDEELTNSIESE